MSKESRHAARLARESRRAGASRQATGSGEATSGSTADPTSAPSPATGRTNRTPGQANRAGRRERVRPGVQPGFLERYRTAIVTVAAVAIAAVAVGFVFIGSTQPAYACTNTFDPSPTPVLGPESSARLGFQQDDMGNSHVVNAPQRYLYCPPASGNHYNAAGQGPIQARVYKPDDKVGPSNWIHNLEHGGLVVLYRNDSPGATAAGQQAFRDFFDAFPASPICQVPPGQLSPVVARFDLMPHAYAALVWDRVFYLDTWDPALVDKFYLTEAERLDKDGALIAPPEDVTSCKARLASQAPSAAPSAAPSGAASPSAAAPSTVPSASSEPSPAAS